jgi:PKD repeat protein
VIYRFGAGTETNATMTHTTGNNYELGISIQHSIETLHYRIVAVDLAGNWNSTAVKDVSITDNDDPVADAGPDQTAEEGTMVSFDGSGSTDNIGIVNYTWTFNDGVRNTTHYGVSPVHNFTVAGNYTITLTVFDAAGNNDMDTMVVTVNALPPDNDGDGISDDTDPDDDNDGFLDEWEVCLSTDPKDSNDVPTDTDGDGTPDGDADNSEPWMDTDDDGDDVEDAVDFAPLDPTVTEPPTDGGIREYWWVIVIIIVIAIVSGLLILRRKPGAITEPDKADAPLDEEV